MTLLQRLRFLLKPQGIVLALGSGGARGLAHLGVLEVLEEARIPVAAVVGSSAGAMVGAMWIVSGDSPSAAARWREFLSSEIATSFPDVRLNESTKDGENFLLVLARRVQRQATYAIALERRGLVEQAEFDRAVAFLLPDLLIEDLRLPLGVVMTDFHSGRSVMTREGFLRRAVAASSAVPGFVPPYIFQEHAFIDGGVVSEVPVEHARTLDLGPVVAVDVGDVPGPEDAEEVTVARALMRSSVLTGMALRELQLEGAAFVLRPQVGHIHWSELSRLDEALAAGRAAATAALPRLRTLSRSPFRPRGTAQRSAVTAS